jgi:hypothetical protein
MVVTLKTNYAGLKVTVLTTSGQALGSATSSTAQSSTIVTVPVSGGAYSIVVTGTGSKASFTLTITYPI